MTTRMYAHASTAAALLLTAAACHPDLHPRWIALTTLGCAVLFAWLARRQYAQARLEQALGQRLKRLADEAGFVLPPPCCPFWLHSDGEVHAPRCRRSTESTVLTPREEQEFTRIQAAFHRTGGTA
ncbi:hypothetical protein [Streptomyces scabiei]|uniref:hypothetical protein n=1 Tax=Streptomyces scabiei TaxID=1930 RepID=UPI0029B44B63|nr:hypothetical protein [Streptomyces scabiei]MDX3202105.1 hypothetical protein [Streptomyces scabiei]MDX3217718.1 hypothetical protein [Streptomyces scabiei]